MAAGARGAERPRSLGRGRRADPQGRGRPQGRATTNRGNEAAGLLLGRAASNAWAMWLRPHSADLPVHGSLGGAGAGGGCRGPRPAGRRVLRRLSWRGRASGRNLAGRVRWWGDKATARVGSWRRAAWCARDDAADEEEERTASGMDGHAEGTRGAAAPVLQKWLRKSDKTGRPRNPAGRLLLLPSLPADDDPTQQT